MSKRWIGWVVAAVAVGVLAFLVVYRAPSSPVESQQTAAATLAPGPATALPTVYEFTTET